jgi:carbon monoxide dehydrogenase subunit G
MKLEGDFLFDAPVEDVWKALLDPVVLAAVMPGCDKLELVPGPDPKTPQYQGELNIKVGPIQGKFTGKVDLKDLEEPRRYGMVIDGRGAPGFVKANAVVILEPEGSSTRMRYDADAQVGGKIASVGQRLIEASSRAIAKQSLEGLNENIKIRMAARAAEAAPTVSLAAAPRSTADAPLEAAKDAAADPAPGPIERPPAPVVLKQVDQKVMAARIAQEVTKSLLPQAAIAAVAIGAALLAWLLFRR